MVFNSFALISRSISFFESGCPFLFPTLLLFSSVKVIVLLDYLGLQPFLHLGSNFLLKEVKEPSYKGER